MGVRSGQGIVLGWFSCMTFLCVVQMRPCVLTIAGLLLGGAVLALQPFSAELFGMPILVGAA